MDIFFGPEGNPFVMYSVQHWIALAGVFLSARLVVHFRKRLRRPPWNALFRYSLAGMMLLLFIGLQIWYIRAGQWDIAHSLPLHLSTISLLASVLLLINKNYYLFEFIYFAGIGSALQALFTPVLDIAFPHFWYFYFFMGHGGIILAAVYFAAVERYRPVLKSIARTMLWLNVLVVIIFPINLITGGNYMFIARKPQTVSLLDLLGPWPWYILPLEAAALIICILLYMPFALLRKFHSSNR